MPSTLIDNLTDQEIDALLRDASLQIGLAGPPGVGKTYRCFQTGKVMRKPVWKIQAHSELSPAEILGMHVPEETKFRWEPGPIDLAYTHGGILVLDELIEASGPVKTFLYGACDRGPGGTISYVGRQFVQTKGYQPIATMNGWPNQGGLPAALLDRFDAWVLIAQPSEQQYKLLEPDLRDICRSLYAAAADPMDGPVVTFRMLIGLQKLRKILPLPKAVLSACYGDQQLAHSLLEVVELSDDVEDDDIAAVAEAISEDDNTAAAALASGSDDDDEEWEDDDDDTDDDD